MSRRRRPQKRMQRRRRRRKMGKRRQGRRRLRSRRQRGEGKEGEHKGEGGGGGRGFFSAANCEYAMPARRRRIAGLSVKHNFNSEGTCTSSFSQIRHEDIVKQMSVQKNYRRFRQLRIAVLFGQVEKIQNIFDCCAHSFDSDTVDVPENENFTFKK
ncbi:unnamed protein product [Nesidiocoris tenuis]|uniref:Uncharacterized protein n=1 Tax=Nesidiocoris tenuis TaxID=355587 RepID=A0A6H5FXT8_9HEMI|nr:unnamed protein product [Nesidiocoris tenuis]